ncbi:MAG: alcohol dehydrogenase [Betaproteobacteria bacterium RIFCSPLOWO2_12_FULL_68_20]|nr:MAG: alcohol dehydrogenase [Betaproteobacteria bacterium RIFCSPLOWO2_12_FULL_68_20]
MGAAQLFQAMRLHAPRAALSLDRLPVPEPGAGQILVKVRACGVCRTDLHVADGELPHPKLPLVPGHEIVGEVVSTGIRAKRYSAGTRVGIPWLGWTCGECEFCAGGRENLCERARFTGYHLDGGYAGYALADERYCLPIPERYGDVAAAPLLCAGLIGYRSYSMAGDARKLGLYGFGAAAHVLSQIARAEGRQVFAFVRPGDAAGIAFARRLGAAWAGGSDEAPPEPLDAAIIFAAVGALVPLALKAVKKGGRVICGGIHMSDIPSFPYSLLWGERRVQSVANLTRADGERFMALAAKTPLATEVKTYPLEKANEALADLREGKLQGAAVLLP